MTRRSDPLALYERSIRWLDPRLTGGTHRGFALYSCSGRHPAIACCTRKLPPILATCRKCAFDSVAEVSLGTKVVPSNLRIVGIGASAGGVEALEAFFKAMPSDGGM